jgi:hypothetical protein
MPMPPQALVLVQRQLAGSPVDAAQRDDAAVALMRLSLLCRTAAVPLMRARAVQLKLLHDRQQLAELRAQHAALRQRHADLEADYQQVKENEAYEDEREYQGMLEREEVVRELGFDPYRPDHRAMITYIREMRGRPASAQPAPRQVQQLLPQRAELYTALGAQPDYDEHMAVLGHVAELRRGLPLTPFRTGTVQP